MKYFIMFTLLAFLAVIAYMPLLKHIIAPRYWDGLRVVPIVMMAEIFMGIYFNLSFWYKLIAKTHWGAIISAVGCAVLLAVNIVFVPRYGYMACAWGGFFGYGVCMLLSYFLGQHYNPTHYQLGRIAAFFALALALYAAMTLTGSDATWKTLLLNTLILAIYVAAVAYRERELLGKIKNKLTRR